MKWNFNNYLSPILGMVSISLFCLPKGLGPEFLLFAFLALLFAILGLILGKKGLKSAKRNLSIIGIVVCSIGLLGSIYMFLGWLLMGGWIYL